MNLENCDRDLVLGHILVNNFLPGQLSFTSEGTVTHKSTIHDNDHEQTFQGDSVTEFTII